MRKLIVSNILSLDGYCAGPNNNVMAMPMDHAFDEYNAERLRAATTLVLGRATFQMFERYWPSVADDPSSDATNREISRLDNSIAKLVISNELAHGDLRAWRDTTSIVRRADAARAITDLKQQPGGDLLVFGSHTMWNGLLAAGVVDELHLMIGAVVLGGGTPAFDRPTALRTLETRRWPDSNNVLVRYAPA
jgi:dihydrofolate reductase